MVDVMLEPARGLTTTALEAIRDLERRVVANDGGRLKLEWGALRSRSPDEVRDLLWWDDGRLFGFLGIYSHGWPTLELAGMVDPAARRRGIARELLGAALPICRAKGAERLLLVVPRSSPAGGLFAESLGLTHDHSEHALRLREPPAAALAGAPAATVRVADPSLTVRDATASDLPDLSRLFLDGFGEVHTGADRPLVDDRRRTLMIERDGATVGTLSVAREGGEAAMYGFVVASAWRGRGIGRAILTQVSRELFDAGADQVTLEVETANDRALGLYTSVGFSRVGTEDYHVVNLD
jgi:ribosomal protein S18 acetylase RimI-like enzyme